MFIHGKVICVDVRAMKEGSAAQIVKRGWLTLRLTGTDLLGAACHRRDDRCNLKFNFKSGD